MSKRMKKDNYQQIILKYNVLKLVPMSQYLRQVNAVNGQIFSVSESRRLIIIQVFLPLEKKIKKNEEKQIF